LPTVIGLIFFAASVCFFFLKDDKLFALVIFSAIFASSSVVDLNGAGIEPYYLVATAFILQSIIRGRIRIGASNSFRGKRWMISFAIIGILSAVTLPFVFAGIPVYDPHLGIDDGLFIRPPLQFTHTNLTHSLFLLVDVLVVLAASQTFRGRSVSKKAYTFTFYFLAGTVMLQFLLPLIGIEFPYSLLQNHAGVNLSTVEAGDLSSRYPGTFLEPSGAGQVLGCFTAGFLAERLKFGRSLFLALAGLTAVFLIRSSGSIAAVGVTFVLLLLSFPIFRFPYYINITRLRRAVLMIGIGALVLTAIIFSPLRDSLIEMTLNKQESGSYVNRIASDAYALNLLTRTYEMGVGMGSNRPSSIITSLLSTVGVLGLVAFVLTYFKLLSNARLHDSWVRWAGLALFISMATSGPDYDAPWLWAFLAFAVRMGKLSNEELPEIDGLPDRKSNNPGHVLLFPQ